MINRSILLVALALVTLVSTASQRAVAQQPTVLAELFTNVDCSNCRIPDDKYTTYVAAHPGIVQINYHNSSPDATDVFYLDSSPASGDRDGFYHGGTAGLSDPTTFIDGFFAGSGQTEAQWENVSTSSLAQPLTPITITKTVNAGDSITLSFSVSSQNAVKVFVALVESGIVYQNSKQYGSPTNNIWNSVFRMMLPTANGSPVFTGGKSFSIIYDKNAHAWVADNMMAVVFVQASTASDNQQSHAIESIGTISLGGNSAVATDTHATVHLRIVANPTPRLSRIGVELQQPAHVRIVMSDMLGRPVETFADMTMPAGSTAIEVVNPVPAGCYLIRMFVDGQPVDYAKVVVE